MRPRRSTPACLGHSLPRTCRAGSSFWAWRRRARCSSRCCGTRSISSASSFLIILVGFSIRAVSDWLTEGESVSAWALAAVFAGLFGTVLVGFWLFGSRDMTTGALERGLPPPVLAVSDWFEAHGWGQRVLLGGGGSPTAPSTPGTSAVPQSASAPSGGAVSPRAEPESPSAPASRASGSESSSRGRKPASQASGGEAEAATASPSGSSARRSPEPSGGGTDTPTQEAASPPPVSEPVTQPAVEAASTGTSTTLASSHSASAVGTSVRFTATVTADGSGVPTGVVVFFDGDRAIGTAARARAWPERDGRPRDARSRHRRSSDRRRVPRLPWISREPFAGDLPDDHAALNRAGSLRFAGEGRSLRSRQGRASRGGAVRFAHGDDVQFAPMTTDAQGSAAPELHEKRPLNAPGLFVGMAIFGAMAIAILVYTMVRTPQIPAIVSLDYTKVAGSVLVAEERQTDARALQAALARRQPGLDVGVPDLSAAGFVLEGGSVHPARGTPRHRRDLPQRHFRISSSGISSWEPRQTCPIRTTCASSTGAATSFIARPQTPSSSGRTARAWTSSRRACRPSRSSRSP